MDNTEIQSILQTLGKRVPRSSRLILVGGSALALLGSPRLTIDIDFVGDDIHPNELHRSIMQIAKEQTEQGASRSTLLLCFSSPPLCLH